ncbi:phosphonate metabolism protein PhnM [Salipiger aestuarii]|uniref:Alpha-D-ribose 1-methylphosphonate 5-triphosphate diphosphatase n=1 Tax=Salipiger aestuarii TaxID=568098 RepID=A0A327YRX5_9RHOB|nr:alpha-D-ribose 1-methylphosphonate 5-triphosphate diphosphatase [Salipiger aestuarii]EIE49236.1 phosphonate metabolism protein PhnM [Citreicella sp. 357]KAA8609757.1 phosphonate metabolism protein PhnM [Salipiger aestuarii]KAA8614088.1 phosphonate metabolism protein PhnM [Salipiger aestuarii]KAB2543617.1 phosphonate metabolism protein PhnM [Salipiger aestuarii]RAK22847.1 alpha-D-ribose 1-methylphosphonate 5-triphosphate diphosphatase [Salipiger aestuarii]
MGKMNVGHKMSPGEIIFANAQLVLEGEVIRGAVRVRDGRIAAVDQGGGVPSGAVECDGDLLIPGLIELHTDNLERHIQPRPKVDWPHLAAILAHDAELAGVGITTVFDAMRVGSVISDGRTDYRKYARPVASEVMAARNAGMLKISHLLHLRAEVCSETLLEELDEFTNADRVGILSIMDHTPGQRQFRDLSKLKQYVCGKHGMSEAQFAEHVAGLTAIHARLGAAHETGAVAAARRLGAVLASHDDTLSQHVAASAGHGVQLAEFPTTPEAAQACHDHGIAVMMGAPNLIRGGSHSGNVAASELAEAGLLDILSSDYVPSALMTGAFRLAELWDDLPRALSTVTAAPARATGLDDRGCIAPGLLADLVRVRLIDGAPVVRGVWSHGRQVG